MNNEKKVAIIMSVYKDDEASALVNAVNSMLNQTYPCDIFIFRDGDVPANIQNIIEKIIKKPRVNFFYGDQNVGLARSLNKLIDQVIKSDYKFIARMDSDDISRSDRIAKQVAYFNVHSTVDVCGTSCREFGANYALDEKHLPRTHEQLLNFSITRCPFIHPSVMFRCSVFIDGNRYPTDTALTEDMAFWFDLLKKGYKFGNLNDVLLDYRLNENTIDRRKGIGKAISEIRIRTNSMFALRQFSLKNCLLIYSRIIFHLMPSFLVKLAYKKVR